MNSDRYRIQMRFQESLEKHKNRLLKTRGKNVESTYGKFISESFNKKGVSISSSGKIGLSNEHSTSIKKPTPIKIKIPISRIQKSAHKKIEIKATVESKIGKRAKVISSMNYNKLPNPIKTNAPVGKEVSHSKIKETMNNNANIKISDNKKGSDFQKVPNELGNNLNDLFRNFVNCKINNLYVITGERGSNGKNEINLTKEDAVQTQSINDQLQLQNINFETNMIVHQKNQPKGDEWLMDIEDEEPKDSEKKNHEKEKEEMGTTVIPSNLIKPLEEFSIDSKKNQTKYEENYKRLLKLERNMKKSIQDFEEKTKLCMKTKEKRDIDSSNESNLIPYVKVHSPKISKNIHSKPLESIPQRNHSDELTLMNSSNTSLHINVSSSSVSVYSSNGHRFTSALTGMELFTTHQHIFVEDKGSNKKVKEPVPTTKEEKESWKNPCSSNSSSEGIIIEKPRQEYRKNHYTKEEKRHKYMRGGEFMQNKNRSQKYENHDFEDIEEVECITDTLTYSSCSKYQIRESSKIQKKSKRRERQEALSSDAWEQENAPITASPTSMHLTKKRNHKERTHGNITQLIRCKKYSSDVSSDYPMNSKGCVLKRKSGLNTTTANITEHNLRKYEQNQLKRHSVSRKIKKQYEMKHHEQDLFRLIKTLSEKMKKDKVMHTDESTASWKDNYKNNQSKIDSFLFDSDSSYNRKKNRTHEAKEEGSSLEEESSSSNRIIRISSEKLSSTHKSHSTEINKMHLYKIEEFILNKNDHSFECKNPAYGNYRTHVTPKESFVKKEIEKWKKEKVPNYLKNSHHLKNVLSNIYNDKNHEDLVEEKENHLIKKNKKKDVLSHPQELEPTMHKKERTTFFNELNEEEKEIEETILSKAKQVTDGYTFLRTTRKRNHEYDQKIEAMHGDGESYPCKQTPDECIQETKINTNFCHVSSSVVRENLEELENESMDVKNDHYCNKDVCDLCAYPILENEPKFYINKEQVFKELPLDLIKRSIQERNSLKNQSLIKEQSKGYKEIKKRNSSQLFLENNSKEMEKEAKQIMYVECVPSNKECTYVDSYGEVNEHGLQEKQVSQPMLDILDREESKSKIYNGKEEKEEEEASSRTPRVLDPSYQSNPNNILKDDCEEAEMKEEDVWRVEWKKDMEETMKIKTDSKINNQVLKKLLKMKIETLKGELPQMNSMMSRKGPMQEEGYLIKESIISEAFSKQEHINDKKPLNKKKRKDKIHQLKNEINEIQKNLTHNNEMSQMSVNKLIDISKNKIEELKEYKSVEPMESNRTYNTPHDHIENKLVKQKEETLEKPTPNVNNNSISHIDYFLNSSNDFASHKSVAESCDTILIKNIKNYMEEKEQPLSFGVNDNHFLESLEKESQIEKSHEEPAFALKVPNLINERKVHGEKESMLNMNHNHENFDWIASNEIEALDFDRSYYCNYVNKIENGIYPQSEEPISEKEKHKLMKAYLNDKKKKLGNVNNAHSLKYNIEYFKLAKLFSVGSNEYRTILRNMQSCLLEASCDEVDQVAFSIIKMFNKDAMSIPASSVQVDPNDTPLSKLNEPNNTCLNTLESIIYMSENEDSFKNVNKPTLDEEDFPCCMKKETDSKNFEGIKMEKLEEVSKNSVSKNYSKINRRPLLSTSSKHLGKTRYITSREGKQTLPSEITRRTSQGSKRNHFDNTPNGTSNLLTSKKQEHIEKYGKHNSKQNELLKYDVKTNMNGLTTSSQVPKNASSVRSCSCKSIPKNKNINLNKNDITSHRSSVSTTKPNALLKTSVLIQRYEKMKCK